MTPSQTPSTLKCLLPVRGGCSNLSSSLFLFITSLVQIDKAEEEEATKAGKTYLPPGGSFTTWLSIAIPDLALILTS